MAVFLSELYVAESCRELVILTTDETGRLYGPPIYTTGLELYVEKYTGMGRSTTVPGIIRAKVNEDRTVEWIIPDRLSDHRIREISNGGLQIDALLIKA